MHPQTKLERFTIGKNKGIKRTPKFKFHYVSEDLINKQEQIHRNTTQNCSCSMCQNPRRNKWFKKDKLTLQERKENEKGL